MSIRIDPRLATDKYRKRVDEHVIFSKSQLTEPVKITEVFNQLAGDVSSFGSSKDVFASSSISQIPLPVPPVPAELLSVKQDEQIPMEIDDGDSPTSGFGDNINEQSAHVLSDSKFKEKVGKLYPKPAKASLWETFQTILNFHNFMNTNDDEWLKQHKHDLIDFSDTQDYITNKLFNISDYYTRSCKKLKAKMDEDNKSMKAILADKDFKIKNLEEQAVDRETKLRNARQRIELLEKLHNDDMQKIVKLEEKSTKTSAKSLEEKIKSLEKELLVSKSGDEIKREEFRKQCGFLNERIIELTNELKTANNENVKLRNDLIIALEDNKKLCQKLRDVGIDANKNKENIEVPDDSEEEVQKADMNFNDKHMSSCAKLNNLYDSAKSKSEKEKNGGMIDEGLPKILDEKISGLEVNFPKLVGDKSKLAIKRGFAVSVPAMNEIPAMRNFSHSRSICEIVKPRIKPGELKRRRTFDKEEPKRRRIVKNKVNIMDGSEKADDVKHAKNLKDVGEKDLNIVDFVVVVDHANVKVYDDDSDLTDENDHVQDLYEEFEDSLKNLFNTDEVVPENDTSKFIQELISTFPKCTKAERDEFIVECFKCL